MAWVGNSHYGKFSYTREDLEQIAAIVAAEDDNTQGMIDVATSVANRAAIAKVSPTRAATAKSQYSAINTSAGRTKAAKQVGTAKYNKALSVVNDVFSGKVKSKHPEITHYKTHSNKAPWGKTLSKLGKTKNHTAYKAPIKEVRAVTLQEPNPKVPISKEKRAKIKQHVDVLTGKVAPTSKPDPVTSSKVAAAKAARAAINDTQAQTAPTGQTTSPTIDITPPGAMLNAQFEALPGVTTPQATDALFSPAPAAPKSAIDVPDDPAKVAPTAPTAAPTASYAAFNDEAGRVSSEYGSKTHPSGSHQGIDIARQTPGTSAGSVINSPVAGTVVSVDNWGARYGKAISVQPENMPAGSRARIGHITGKLAKGVKPGAKITVGQPVGTLTGTIAGPHAHVDAKGPKGQRVAPSSVMPVGHVANPEGKRFQGTIAGVPVTPAPRGGISPFGKAVMASEKSYQDKLAANEGLRTASVTPPSKPAPLPQYSPPPAPVSVSPATAVAAQTVAPASPSVGRTNQPGMTEQTAPVPGRTNQPGMTENARFPGTPVAPPSPEKFNEAFGQFAKPDPFENAPTVANPPEGYAVPSTAYEIEATKPDINPRAPVTPSVSPATVSPAEALAQTSPTQQNAPVAPSAPTSPGMHPAERSALGDQVAAQNAMYERMQQEQAATRAQTAAPAPSPAATAAIPTPSPAPNRVPTETISVAPNIAPPESMTAIDAMQAQAQARGMRQPAPAPAFNTDTLGINTVAPPAPPSVSTPVSAIAPGVVTPAPPSPAAVAPVAPMPAPAPVTPPTTVAPAPPATPPAPTQRAPTTAPSGLTDRSFVPGLAPGVRSAIEAMNPGQPESGMAFGYGAGGTLAQVSVNAPDHVQAAATGPGVFGLAGKNTPDPSKIGATVGTAMGGPLGGLMGAYAVDRMARTPGTMVGAKIPGLSFGKQNASFVDRAKAMLGIEQNVSSKTDPQGSAGQGTPKAPGSGARAFFEGVVGNTTMENDIGAKLAENETAVADVDAAADSGVGDADGGDGPESPENPESPEGQGLGLDAFSGFGGFGYDGGFF